MDSKLLTNYRAAPRKPVFLVDPIHTQVVRRSPWPAILFGIAFIAGFATVAGILILAA